MIVKNVLELESTTIENQIRKKLINGIRKLIIEILNNTIRKKHDVEFKIRCNIRSRVKNFLKSKNIKKNNQTFKIVGCEPARLKEHLETQFKDGMSWENYCLNGLHIDHIIPLINGKTEDEIFKLCHYTNLQPLWWYENLEKRY